MAKKEDVYVQQLKSMGIWDEAFSGAVHDLAVLERERSRTRKDWKAAKDDEGAAEYAAALYDVLLRQQREIDALREALGLTPKSLRRIRGEFDGAPAKDETKGATVLDLVRARQRRQA